MFSQLLKHLCSSSSVQTAPPPAIPATALFALKLNVDMSFIDI